MIKQEYHPNMIKEILDSGETQMSPEDLLLSNLLHHFYQYRRAENDCIVLETVPADLDKFLARRQERDEHYYDFVHTVAGELLSLKEKDRLSILAVVDQAQTGDPLPF